MNMNRTFINNKIKYNKMNMNRTFRIKQFANVYPRYTSTGTWESFEQSSPSEAYNLAIKVGIELDKRYDIDTELITKKDAINQIEAITTRTGYMNPAPYSIKGYEGIYDVINNGDIVFFGRRVNESKYTPSWDRIIIIVNFESNKVTSFMLTPGHWTMSGEDYIYGRCKSETIDLSRLGKFDTNVIDDYLDSVDVVNFSKFLNLNRRFFREVFNSRPISGTKVTEEVLNDLKKNCERYHQILINKYPELIKYWTTQVDGSAGAEIIMFILLYCRANGHLLTKTELDALNKLISLCDYNIDKDPYNYLNEQYLYHIIFYGGDTTDAYKEYARLIDNNSILKSMKDLLSGNLYKEVFSNIGGYGLIEYTMAWIIRVPDLSKPEFIERMNLMNINKDYPKFVDSLYEDYLSIDTSNFR